MFRNAPPGTHPSIRALLQGNATFRDTYVTRERAFLEELASAHQSPSTLFVGCSDSRVVPELLTGSSPGELFVVRNVANLVPPQSHADASVGAAIDYAVGVLRVEHVVVCGHVGCGGVRAILEGHAAMAHLPSLHEWLDGAAQDVLAGEAPSPPSPASWRDAVGRNVLAQLDNLGTYAVVADALRAGGIQLHGWVYDMASGRVQVYDAVSESFVDAASLG